MHERRWNVSKRGGGGLIVHQAKHIPLLSQQCTRRVFYFFKILIFVYYFCVISLQIEDDATKFGRPLGVRTVSVIGGVRKAVVKPLTD